METKQSGENKTEVERERTNLSRTARNEFIISIVRFNLKNESQFMIEDKTGPIKPAN